MEGNEEPESLLKPKFGQRGSQRRDLTGLIRADLWFVSARDEAK